MLSTKRKALDTGLQRRVRARREASEEIDESSSDSAPSETGKNDVEEGGSSSDGEVDDEDDEESSESEEEASNGAASISFGALAKAQATMSKPSKRDSKNLKKSNGDGWEDNEATERKAGKKDQRDFTRSSKNAPTEISSKKAVSRRREVVPVKKREIRDPRFEPTNGPVDMQKIEKNYDFLVDYREDEMKKLKETIRKTKDEDEKEKLKRELLRMESRKKTDARKRKAREVLDKHRKEEKELVKEGKTPYYLKKAEQKKRVLLDTFGELKGRQLDRVIERRRKKVEGKEKKNMPRARRMVE
ncbi:putative rrna processing protein [Botrytis fragariae]|uniref:rRNA biogenesis protein RRP36 n=1 Tax=Botrytis fragariae TaxID=1964551 RepID=A0A8H6B5G3_9HELO|nr:putative rrna processing protein [Botrytis fragariae]KAF5879604.1 putative rrna processing protein [Botrytis fragariae]